MHEIDRLFEKLDTTFDARAAQDRAFLSRFYDNALNLLLGSLPAAAALSLFF